MLYYFGLALQYSAQKQQNSNKLAASQAYAVFIKNAAFKAFPPFVSPRHSPGAKLLCRNFFVFISSHFVGWRCYFAFSHLHER
jgi:hypothetical protein